MRRILILLLCAFILSGCAPKVIGPDTSPEFNDLIKKTVPKADGNILMVGTGRWHPNAKGFDDKFAAERSGILVITEKSFLIDQWNKSKSQYYIIKRFDLSNMAEISLARWLSIDRLVVRWNDNSFDSFVFTSSPVLAVDNTKTDAAADLLKSIMQNRNN